MDNRFTVGGTNKALIDFFKSSIKTCDEVIAHYNFVIKDISSFISDPKLESSKGSTVQFLKEMKNQWEKFREEQVDALEKVERG